MTANVSQLYFHYSIEDQLDKNVFKYNLLLFIAQ